MTPQKPQKLPTTDQVMAALQKRGCVIMNQQDTELIYARGRHHVGTLPIGVDEIPLGVLEVTLRALGIDYDEFCDELGL